jgi:hypothetical protein
MGIAGVVAYRLSVVVPTIVGTAQLVNGVYTVLDSDAHLQVMAPSTVQINWPDATFGRILRVTDSRNDAIAHPITLVRSRSKIYYLTSNFVFGVGDYEQNGLSIAFAANTTTDNWEIV